MSAGGDACWSREGEKTAEDSTAMSERLNFPHRELLLCLCWRRRGPGARLEGRGRASVWPRLQLRKLFVNEAEEKEQ